MFIVLTVIPILKGFLLLLERLDPDGVDPDDFGIEEADFNVLLEAYFANLVFTCIVFLLFYGGNNDPS